MRNDDFLGDVKAEAQAGGPGIGIPAVVSVKCIEELWYHVTGNGDAFVVH